MTEQPNNVKPILYSFRRCPYAMRARLAIMASKTKLEHREIVLRNKPMEMLQASPKGTVPVLLLPESDGEDELQVIDESLEIALWAAHRNDPLGLLTANGMNLEDMLPIIETYDGPFKRHLDHFKYGEKYPGENPLDHAQAGAVHLNRLDDQLANQRYMFGDELSFADLMILPFVRQFAGVDRDWFYEEDWPHIIRWLTEFLESDLYMSVMEKCKPWKAGDEVVWFGG